MAYENSEAEKLFNPQQVGESLRGPIPIEGYWLNGIVSGENISFRKGQGSERNGTHPYVAGESTRYIDWKATQKSQGDVPIVREHYDDITPTLYVVTDILKNRYTVNPGISSEQLLGVSAIAAVLRTADLQEIPTALVAASDRSLYVQQTPNIGRRALINTGHDLATMIDPDLPISVDSSGRRRGRAGKIETPELAQAQDLRLGDSIKRASQLSGRSLQGSEAAFLVVADFRDDLDPVSARQGWLQQMKRLHKAGSMILAVELTNRDDFEIPEGDVTLQANEKRRWIGSGKKDKLSQVKRDKYAEITANQQIQLDRILGKLTVGHIKLSTDQGKEPGEWLKSFRSQLQSIYSRA